MRAYRCCLFNSRLFTSHSPKVLVPLLLLMAAFPSFGASLSVQYTLIARSGVTPIPNGVGTFTDVGGVPAIDEAGNVFFTATGGADGTYTFQSGVYTYLGTCCQKVADKNTLVPGGGGAKFYVFSGDDRNDIDGGRVAFTANTSSTAVLWGLYSNVGQAAASNLVKVALVDGVDWSSKGDAYIDGNIISMRGKKNNLTTILRWDGATNSSTFIDPGTGYIVSPSSQAPLSGDAFMFWRYKTGSSQIGISVGGTFEPLATANSTPMPGLAGRVFTSFRDFFAIDRSGLDAAFVGNDGVVEGLFKRANGGALGNVADTTTIIPGTLPIPGAGDQHFVSFGASGLSTANGSVLFYGGGPNSLEGLYTDIGGGLSVIVDDANNRCNQENLIAQLKNGVSAMRMPVDTLVSNWAYMVMSALAWNLKAWYALLLPVSPRWDDKHKHQKQHILRMEFKKFRTFFVMLPCRIVKTGRRLLYKLLGWNEYLEIFFRALDFLALPLRC